MLAYVFKSADFLSANEYRSLHNALIFVHIIQKKCGWLARRSRGKLVAVVFFKHTPDAHEDRGTLGDGITPMSNNNEPLTGAKYLEQWREPVSCKIHPEHPAMSMIH